MNTWVPLQNSDEGSPQSPQNKMFGVGDWAPNETHQNNTQVHIIFPGNPPEPAHIHMCARGGRYESSAQECITGFTYSSTPQHVAAGVCRDSHWKASPPRARTARRVGAGARREARLCTPGPAPVNPDPPPRTPHHPSTCRPLPLPLVALARLRTPGTHHRTPRRRPSPGGGGGGAGAGTCVLGTTRPQRGVRLMWCGILVLERYSPHVGKLV
eukprot:gene13153-biopygen15557